MSELMQKWMPTIINLIILAMPFVTAFVLWEVRKFVRIHQGELWLKRVAKAAKGAAAMLEVIAAKTPNKMDNAVAKLLSEVAKELNREKLEQHEINVIRGVANSLVLKNKRMIAP